MFMQAIICMKTPWPILSVDQYWMIEKAWKLPIEAQDRQRALAGAPLSRGSVCLLPGGRSLKIDSQSSNAVSLEISFVLH